MITKTGTTEGTPVITQKLNELDRAFAEEAQVLQMVVVAGMEGWQILSMNSRHENVAKYPTVGKHLIETLRDYADKLELRMMGVGSDEPLQ